MPEFRLFQNDVYVLNVSSWHIKTCAGVNIGAIACRGFANATTIIISQELGKDQIDTAGEYGKRMLRITPVSYTHLDVYKRQNKAFAHYRF